MTPTTGTREVEIFSTCPQSKDVDRADYLGRVRDIARWSDEAGYRGILVYTDNGLVDPWLVSQLILQSTTQLSPLVAVQPVYMHPYSAAKMVSSLAYLHGRKVFLNMLAGGFKGDLAALNDETPHDERYERTVEYTLVMKALLQGGAVTFAGRYYTVTNLRMTPPLPDELVPGILISGSSDAGVAAARAIDATAVRYPRPAGEEDEYLDDETLSVGVRVGVVARADSDEAWRVANERFPEDRKGELTHGLAMRVSDSHWHRQLSELDERPAAEDDPYWLRPFQTYKTFCPYLVGTYEIVGRELARYTSMGYRTFILDIPPSEEEIDHTARAFAAAKALASA